MESNDPIDLNMTWAEVQKTNESDLFSIRGQSHTHTILTFLNDEQLTFELDTCLDLLKEKSGVSSEHFAYPEGFSYCYSDKVIKELKKEGYVVAPQR